MPKQVIAFANTEVAAEKSALEIETMLINNGCEKIAKEFESGRIMSINETTFFLTELANEETNVAAAEAEVVRWQTECEKRRRRIEALRNLVEVLEANPVD